VDFRSGSEIDGAAAATTAEATPRGIGARRIGRGGSGRRRGRGRVLGEQRHDGKNHPSGNQNFFHDAEGRSGAQAVNQTIGIEDFKVLRAQNSKEFLKEFGVFRVYITARRKHKWAT